MRVGLRALTRCLAVAVLVSVLASLVASCKGAGKGDRESEAPRAHAELTADAATSELVAATGSDAALVFVLRDHGWSTLREHLADQLRAESDGLAAGLAGAADPVAGAAAVLDALGLELGAPELRGRDPSRPIVLSALEAPFDGPPGAAIARTAELEGRLFPARVQMIVPSTDPAALAASMREWVGAGAREAPELVAGHAGAIGLRREPAWPDPTFAAIVPGTGYVRLVLLHGGREVTASELADSIDPVAAPLPDTPAARLVTDPGQSAALLVRPWKLRAFAAWSGVRETHRALDIVGSEQRDLARVRGFAIAAAIEVLATDEHAELDDWGLALRSDDGGARLAVVASLTPQGRRTWAAGATGRSRPFALARPVLAEAQVQLDVAAMWRAAPVHERHGMTNEELVRTAGESGDLGWVHAALRWPVTAAKTFLGEQQQPSAGDARPVGLHLAWVREGGARWSWAAAITGGDGPPPAALAALFGSTSMEVHEGERDGQKVLLLGRGIDPRTVFALDRPGPASESAAIAAVRVEGDTAGFPGALRGEVHLAGNALVGALVLGGGEPGPIPSFDDATWTSPIRSADASSAAGCLRDAISVLHRQVNEAAIEMSLDRPKMLEDAAKAAAAPIACAAEDPALADTAARLGDAIAVVAARPLLMQLEIGAARRILDQRCIAAGRKGAACDELARIATAAPPLLSSDDARRCVSGDDTWLGLPLVITPREISLSGRNVKREAAEVVAALVDQMTMEARASHEAPLVSLVVEEGMRFDDVGVALEAARTIGARVTIVVRDHAGEPTVIPIDVPRDGSRPVDWKIAPGFRPERATEEEPPPEDEPARTEPKRGLYTGDEPSEGALLALSLTKTGLLATLPDGTRKSLKAGALAELVTSLEGVDSMGYRGVLPRVELRVDADVPWSRFVDVVIAGCRSSVQPTIVP